MLLVVNVARWKSRGLSPIVCKPAKFMQKRI